MKTVVFALPIVVGLGLFGFALALFRKGTIRAREFGLGVFGALLVSVSPFIYLLLDSLRSFFGFRYTFVFGFGLALLIVTGFLIYQMLLIGQLREENKALWQEIAMLRTGVDESEPVGESD